MIRESLRPRRNQFSPTLCRDSQALWQFERIRDGARYPKHSFKIFVDRAVAAFVDTFCRAREDFEFSHAHMCVLQEWIIAMSKC